MRKLNLVALMASICFLGIAGAASATSVSLVLTGVLAGGAGIDSTSSSAVTLNPSGTATLTIDVVLDIDSRGLRRGRLWSRL